MLFGNIVKYINNLAEGGNYNTNELIPKLDEMIDNINLALGTTYTVFSEVVGLNSNTDYKLFPDVYIRNVVCYGALASILLQEDELEGKYKTILYHSRDWLNNMVRDYSQYVDPLYKVKEDQMGGFIDTKIPKVGEGEVIAVESTTTGDRLVAYDIQTGKTNMESQLYGNKVRNPMWDEE